MLWEGLTPIEIRLQPYDIFFLLSHYEFAYIEANIELAIKNASGMVASEATDIMKMLISCNDIVPASTGVKLARIMYAKVEGSGQFANHGDARATTLSQSCTHFHRMIPKWLWDCFMDPKSEYQTVLQKTAQFTNSLGIDRGSSPTFVLIVSCILMAKHAGRQNATPATNAQGMMVINGQEAYSVLNDLKACVKMDNRRMRLPHQGQVWETH